MTLRELSEIVADITTASTVEGTKSMTLRELAELVRRERESRDYVRASFWMTTEAHAEALADHLAAEAALTQAVEQILASEVQQ